MKLGIIGLGNAYKKQIDAINYYDEIEITGICDTDRNKLNLVNLNVFKTTNYKELVNVCDCVLILSPPNTHLKIASYFIRHKINIIIEKPIVNSYKELVALNKLLNKYDANLFNTLHFSFGDEIIWAKNNLMIKKPLKIYSFISDKYVENYQIKKDMVGLCGAYLDETINPLSALAVLFGQKIKFHKLQTKKFSNDAYEYFSKSKFKIDDIDTTIKVDWAKGTNDKYIDLIYDECVIRLDSMNQCVKNLTNGKILFKSDGDRMTNHYINSFKHMLKNKQNFAFSLNLHKELLKAYD